MKLNVVDARGKSCPEPVLMAKKAIEQAEVGIEIIVDNTTAKENIMRFGKNSGYSVSVKQNNDEYTLTLKK